MRSAAVWWIAAIAVVIVIIIFFMFNRPAGDAAVSSQPSPHAIDQSN